MKKILLGIAILVVAYVAFYFLARPIASHHRIVSRMLGPVYYPLRLMTASHAAFMHATGVLTQDKNGNWGVLYPKPPADAQGRNTVNGIGFNVPDSLADTVQSSKGKLVEVDIGKVPDPDYLSNERPVLISVAPAK